MNEYQEFRSVINLEKFSKKKNRKEKKRLKKYKKMQQKLKQLENEKTANPTHLKIKMEKRINDAVRWIMSSLIFWILYSVIKSPLKSEMTMTANETLAEFSIVVLISSIASIIAMIFAYYVVVVPLTKKLKRPRHSFARINKLSDKRAGETILYEMLTQLINALMVIIGLFTILTKVLTNWGQVFVGYILIKIGAAIIAKVISKILMKEDFLTVMCIWVIYFLLIMFAILTLFGGSLFAI
jgi:hypothetical protein